MSEDYRLDVVSVDEPDRPLHTEFFEADDHDAAFAAAEVILRNRHADPERVYGDLWVHVGRNQAEYAATVDVPTGAPAPATTGGDAGPVEDRLRAHESYLRAVAAALGAVGWQVRDWYADPNDPRDGAVSLVPAGDWAQYEEVWVGWQEQRGWTVLLFAPGVHDGPGVRAETRLALDLAGELGRVATLAAPSTVCWALAHMAGVEWPGTDDGFADLDFPRHDCAVANPVLESALDAYRAGGTAGPGGGW